MQQSLVSRWYEMHARSSQFVVQFLNVSQQHGWERRSKGTASQSDEDTSSLPSFSATFPASRSCGPDKGLGCGVCKQSACIKKFKVRFKSVCLS